MPHKGKLGDTVARDDISGRLIHFTKGTQDEAFGTLCTILQEHRLIGGNDSIKGGYHCVCFSEASLASLKHGLVNPNNYSRYSQFGIMFGKNWIFEKGGRPVIYQPDAEYEALCESHRWRHVRYEPIAEKPIDFTWEREWRIQVDELFFDPTVGVVVVPDESWEERLIDTHEEEQDFQIQQYTQVMEEILAIQYREPFNWRIDIC